MRIVSGYGLLTVEKDEHRHMRKMMNPAFSLSNLVSRESVLACDLSFIGLTWVPISYAELDQYHDAIER